jgi:dTMP kinase
VPDRLLILDLDVDTALSRIGTRGDTANEFEQRANLERCRAIFLSLKDEPFARLIDANRDPDEVAESILAALA